LNEEIRTINNNAYLAGQEANFNPVLNLCRFFADRMDNSLEFNSADYRSILLGFCNLPHEIEAFAHINVKSLDKILNVCFIKELVCFSGFLFKFPLFRWRPKSEVCK
jgi:hypothetical protein